MENTAREFKNTPKMDKDLKKDFKNETAFDHISDKATNMRDVVMDKVEDLNLREKYDALQERVGDSVNASVRFLKSRSVYSVIGAGIIGFFIGKWAAGRRSE